MNRQHSKLTRLIALLLSVVLCLIPLSGCSNNTGSDDASGGSETTQNNNEYQITEYTEQLNLLSDQALAEASEYDTSVFGGAPGYLLQQTIGGGASPNIDLQAPSGWELDNRGGNVYARENVEFRIIDDNDAHSFSMTKELMSCTSGEFVFETNFNIQDSVVSNFSYTLSGGEKNILKIVTKDDKYCLESADGKLTEVYTYKANKYIGIKALVNLDTKTFRLIIDGDSYGTFPFADDATKLDRITIATGEKETMRVLLRHVYIYVNYAAYEMFMTAYENRCPYDWTADTSVSQYVKGESIAKIVKDSSQVAPDLYSFSLKSHAVSKVFSAKTDRIVFETKFKLDNSNDATRISLGSNTTDAVSIETVDGNFVLKSGTVLKEGFLTNFWYTLKIVADASKQTADVYINYQLVADDVPFESKVNTLTKLTYETPANTTMIFDDVRVYDDIDLPDDYVSAPEKAVPSGDYEDYDIGMLMYSMWNEGNHYGWDWITAYPDRIPYLGLYNEGSPEVADWVTKFLLEHGITYRVEMFSRAIANVNQPVKLGTRFHALHEGYLNSKYKDDIKFAAMWTTISTETFGGLQDLKDNIIPYIMEYYFKQPNYLIKDNKPVLFLYTSDKFVSILGGLDAANKAIDYWNQACIEEGFDGIIVIPTGTGNFASMAPEFAQGYAFSYAWMEDARNVKTQLDSNDAMIAAGSNIVGSISMGWGRNPWSANNLGEVFATPDTISGVISGLQSRFSEMEDPTNMLLLTCWDEYGEGHFFSPTRVAGFEYLNAVRDTVTDLGAKESEDVPTSASIARMNSLYAGNRRSLKLIQENDPPTYIEDTLDPSKLEVLLEYDFENMTWSEFANWSITKDAVNLDLKNGALRGEATGRDPGVKNTTGIYIDASMVKMVKITTLTEGAGKGQFFFQTTEDTVMGTNGKRFDIIQTNGTEFTEYIGYPYDTSKLEGYITGIRWDPKDDGFPEATNFAIKKIQILGYADEQVNTDERVEYTTYYNGEPLVNTQPVFLKDNIMYIAVHRTFFQMNFKTSWDYSSGTYTVTNDEGTKVVITAGNNILNVDGKDVTMPGNAYYEDGNLFVPIETLMETLGIKAEYNHDDLTIILNKVSSSDAYEYEDMRDLSNPLSWTFNTRGVEGWYGTYFVTSMKGTNGTLKSEMYGNGPILTSAQIDATAANYKTLKLRIKNETECTELKLQFQLSTEKNWTEAKSFLIEITANDTEFKEYTIDLTENLKWKDHVIQLRMTPTKAGSGALYIDEIVGICEHVASTTMLCEGGNCSICGTYIEATGHKYTEEIVADKYLKSAANCDEVAVYYNSCLCGASSAEAKKPRTFTYGSVAHEFSNDNDYVCNSCHYEDLARKIAIESNRKPINWLAVGLIGAAVVLTCALIIVLLPSKKTQRKQSKDETDVQSR